ncbi:MAG: phage protein NinX family protein [Gallionella sp.]
MKVQVSTAIGKTLNWMVAKCEGKTYADVSFLIGGMGYDELIDYASNLFAFDKHWSSEDLRAEILRHAKIADYTTDWTRAGVILAREWIELLSDKPDGWKAIVSDSGDNAPFGIGPTPVIAIMRCYVISKLGYEVEVPEEFVGE